MKKLNLLRNVLGIAWILLIILGMLNSINYLSVIILIVTIILGPLFCGWLCPFGFLQDIMFNIGRKIKLPILKLPNKIDIYLKSIRYILYIILLFPAAAFILNLFTYDPRSNLELILNNQIINAIALFVLVLFSIIFLLNSRLFCKYLCVQGAHYSLFSIGRMFSIARNKRCVNCNKCTQNCTMQINITKSKRVVDISCIKCLKCIQACPVDGAIRYSKNINIRRLITLSIVCIIVFLPNIIKNNLEENDNIAQTFSQIEEVKKHNNIEEYIEIDTGNVDYLETAEQIDEPAKYTDTTIDSEDKISAEEQANEIKEYTGTAGGFKSEITVSVKMRGDEIVDITVIEQADDIR